MTVSSSRVSMTGGGRALALAVCLTLAGLLAACADGGRTPRFADRLNAGDAAASRRDYAEAESQYRAALAEAEGDNPSPPLAGVAYGHLGDNYVAWGKLAEAEEAYRKRVAAVEQAGGAESAEMVSALDDLTSLHLLRENFDAAEAANRRALSVAAGLPEGSSPAVVASARAHRELLERERGAR